MSRWNLIWLVCIAVAGMVGISLTYSSPARNAALQRKHENLKLLVDVLEEVQAKYVKEFDEKKMRDLVEAMINGGLERLDPHSGFIGTDEFKQFRQHSKGKFGGVGIRIGVTPAGQFLVESPMPGTPAYEAGIMAGDIIVKVEGKSTENMPMKSVIEIIQGEPGTDVSLSVLHEGAKEPVDFKLKRAEIKVESVMGDQRSKINLNEWDFWIDPMSKIAYVRVVAFSETTTKELTQIVDGLQKAGMKGLIVDLRSNPGGLLREAVGVSSLFLPEGKDVVTTKGRGGVVEEVYKAQNKSTDMKPGTYYPVAVLINRYSASASEIVAAALQDHFRAVIVGERSYGKGSVQNLIPMENETSALKLTTASYWRPSQKNIHRFPDSKEEDEWGVKPDKGYEVKLSYEDRAEYFRWRRERDVVRRAGEPVKAAPEGKGVRKDYRDPVMEKALEYIRAEMQKQPRQDAQAPAAPMVEPRRMAAVLPQDRSTQFVERR
jgi:carboxyl-terminal processing protease